MADLILKKCHFVIEISQNKTGYFWKTYTNHYIAFFKNTNGTAHYSITSENIYSKVLPYDQALEEFSLWYDNPINKNTIKYG